MAGKSFFFQEILRPFFFWVWFGFILFYLSFFIIFLFFHIFSFVPFFLYLFILKKGATWAFAS
jgi:hypothetical protein